MNQIFRVIWSQAAQAWVAVSELTKAHKKQSATSTAQESAVKILGQFFKLSTLTFAMLGATQAYAAISVATVANEVPDTDVLKGVTLTAQATSNNEKNNSTPTKLDDGTQIKYKSGGKLVDLQATDLKDAVGKLSTDSSSATVTEGTLVDLLNRIRTQYVSINSDSGTNQYNTGAKTYAEAKNGIAIGSNAVVTDSGSIALGYGAKNERVIESGNEMQRAANAVSIGTNALTTFSGSIALGANSEARGESAIVIGQNAHTFSPWDETNKRYVQAYRSILMGFNANASGTNTIGIGSRVQSFANNAIVMGFDAQAKHGGAVVIGLQAQSKGGLDQGLGTVTIGQEASAASSDQNRSSVAVGKRAYTGGSFGYNSTAFNRNQIDGASMSYNSTAIGSNAGTGYNYVDIATTALTGSDNKAIPAGTVLKRHIIRDDQGNATGVEFYSGDPRDDGTGKLIYNSVKTADLGSVSSGYVANMGTSTDNNETVLKKSGFNPKEDSKEYTETFSSKTGSAKGIAYLLTTKSNITNNEQTAIGAESRAIGDSSVAIGTRSIAGTSSVVVGATSTDLRSSPWNRQVFTVEKGIEDYSKLAYGARNDFSLESTGLTNNDSNKSKKVALSVYTELTGRNFANWNRKDAPYGVDGSVVVGSGAHSSAGLGVAQGATSSVMKGALGGIAIGAASTVDVNSRGAVALGMGSIVDVQADGAMALGMGSTVVSSNTKKATNAIAIGTKATADTANSVALGSGSSTVGNSATLEKEGTLQKDLGNGVETLKYGDFFGVPNTGLNATTGAITKPTAEDPGYMVSVGDASTNTYRQIKNVAAGKVSNTSTDAINGSQLFALLDFVSDGWKITGNDTATAVESIVPNDRVSFINGSGTTSSVIKNKDGGADVTFNVNTGTLSKDATGNVINKKPTGTTANAPTYATAQNVADMINANRIKYFSVKSKEDVDNYLNDGAKGEASIAIGPKASSAEADAIAIGHEAKTTDKKATAVGYKSTAKAEAALALGYNSQATALGAVAIGTEAGTTAQLGGADEGSKGTVASGQFATAVGPAATASGFNAFAGGYLANASATYGLALGNGANAASAGGTAIGLNAWTKPTSTVGIAIGNTATAESLRGIALGSRSYANVEGGQKGIDMSQSRTNRYASLTDEAASNRVRTSTAEMGAVSIGANQEFEVYDSNTGKVKVDDKGNPVKSAAITRQLINLAAGTQDTDAVNVAQLRSVSLQVGGDKTVVGTTADNKTTDGTAKPDLLLQTGRFDVLGDGTYLNTEAKQDGLNASVTVKANTQAITPNANGTVTGPTTDGLATAKNVADAISKSGWNIAGNDKTKVDTINPGEQVNFVNGNGTTATVTKDQTDSKDNGNVNVKFDVNTGNGLTVDSDGKITVKNDGDSITVGENGIKVNTGSITAGNTASVADADKNKVATAGDVVNAINTAAWKATSGTEGTGALADGNNTTEQAVKAGDTVTFKAGDNLKIKQDGKNFTYSLNPKLKNLTSAEFKDTAGNTVNITPSGVTITPAAGSTNTNPVTLNQNGLNNGGNAITNVKSNLPETQNNTAANGQPSNATTSQAAPTGVNVNNAATAGDVLNAGWNLQGNGSAVDFVKPYDTVNFANGTNTTVVTSTDGTTSTVKVNVTGLPISYTDAAGNKIAKADDGKWYPVDENGSPNTKATAIDPSNVKTNLVNAAPTTGSKDTTSPTQLGNVTSGLTNYTDANNGGVTPRNNIVNLGDANNGGVSNNTAATVGDLRNMGWVVSSDKTTGDLGTAYSEAVKNANEVKFVGEGSAIVSGKTEDGVRTITVAVDSQSAVEKAQIPVVYTDAAGNKLTKVGDEFYPADSVVNNGNVYPAGSVVIDGKVYPKGSKLVDGKVVAEDGTTPATEVTTTVDPVKKGDIIASMNNGDNNAAPTTLSNVKSNLPNVSDANKNATDVNGDVIKDSTNTKAPITAADAADLVKKAGNNAATVSDVLNAGWNLQNNGEARDFVKPYDTVNFVNGGNTVAVVTTAADGTASDVTFNVTGLPTTFTTADGSPVSKVGDSYYKVDKNGQPVSDAGKPAVGKNADGNYVDEDGNVINPINTANNPLKTNLVNPNVANTTAAPNNQTTTATQLGNVANGANTFDVVDANGNVLKPVTGADGSVKYYPADQVGDDGKLKDETTATEAQPLKLANDGKWYPASQVASNGAPTTGAKAVTPSNVGKAGLIDFANSNPNNAATVGDLQNMGWVVSSDKTTGNLGTAYSDQVRNANEVRFVGTNLATVSGTTDEKGVRIITVDVDAQKTVETAQNPVVYTDNQGNKLTKVGDDFYPADSVVNNGNVYPAGSEVIDGKVYPKGSKKVGDKIVAEDGTTPATEITTTVTPVDKGNIAASMNSGNNKTEPTKLANVGSNLKQVVDPTIGADGKPVDGTASVNNPNGTKADGSQATNAAPTTAAEAAKMLQPYELNADGTVKNDADGKPVRNANYIGNNAATVSDVLNAGWNLQNNGEARDFVKPYDTVNFVNGGNTVAVVTTAADGTTSDVTFNVTGLPTTFTTADGSPVSKVGDNYYKVDKNGQPVSEAGKPAVGKNADGKYVDADGTVINPINTASNPLKTNLVNPNVANTDAAPNNQTKTATQLGNVANGANTFDAVDNTGAPLKQAANGNYYPADKVKADGSLVDGTTDSDIKSPIKLANDGKWYPASEIGANGAPNTGATAVTKPANIGKTGLIDFANSNPNNAATVGDLQNMGWVVSSDKTTGNLGTAYNDQVRNANEVRFVGTNLATVSGTTDENGVRIITVDVDAQKTVETAQNPVVYTDNQGNKLTKVGDNFYKPEDVKNAVVNGGKAYPAGSVVIDGNVYPEGTTKNEAGKYVNNAGEEVKPATEITPVKSGDIIASMNNGDNKTEPTKLANVGSNLKQVVDPTIGADGKPVDGTASVNNPDGKKAAGDQSTNKAPITAKDAADLLKPTIADKDGKQVTNPNYIGNNAATVSDVLNAGWNLQNNGEARDFVKPYDTVNFVNGGNTVAVVTTAADGTTSDVTFNVTGLPTTFTTADGSPVSKVGDNYYKVDKNGQPVSDNGKPAVGKNADGNYVDEDGNVINPINTANNPLKTNLVNPNVANTTTAPNNQTNTATQLGNVANGANTIAPVDKDGKALKLANNGKYYPADQVNDDGSLKDEANSTEAQPLKLANDGKWYPANQVNANGSTVENAAPVTTQLNPGKAGLIDFANSNPNNAATVGDLQNMGWVVSSDKTTNGTGAYNDQVRNANEVKFVGINGAIVSGQTVDGVRTITVSMDTAGITNNPNGSAISDAQKAADDAKKALDDAIAKNTSNPTADNQKAVDNAQKAYDDANKAVTDAGNKLVTANTVTNAINNSGWNLQNNGEQKDLVKPSDIVNFVNGGNTVANVTTAADGKSSDVTFNVVGLPIANTVTGEDGKQVPLVKVGDNYYPANTDGTPNITKDAAGNPTNGYVLADDGKYYPAGDVDFGTKDGKATITPKADKAPVTVNTNLVNPNAPKGGDQVNNATQLGNVANGANTFDAPKVDANGNELTKVGDQYYTADQLVNGQPKEGAKGLVQGNDGNIYNADDLNNGVPKENAKPAAEGMKLANDGKWYKASDVDTKGTPAANAKPVTPTNPGNAGLIDFANSNPNNAATVGDLQNMGWVVSTSDKDGKETYNNQVRNNNKVDFKGEGLATVTGKTLEDGTRQITVSVKAGEVVPTDKDQNSGKATIKDNDGKDQTIDVVKASDGNWYPADQVTRTTDDNGNTVINPNQGATAIAQNNVTVPNAGSGLVTGNQVGDAIQQSGWNVGLADKAKADAAFGDSSKALSADKLEKVNPDDNVRFADGKGTKVSAATVEEINKDGKKVTNTYVKVDIDAGEVKANENGSVSGPVTKEISDNLTKANDDLAKANQAVTDANNNVAKAQKAIDDATSAGQPISADLQKALNDAKAAQTTAQADRTTAQNAQSAAQNAFNNAGNQVATAQNVADAINNSGFNLKTSGNKVPGTQDNGELIKPSNTVEMIAGKNLTVKQDTNGKVTYETANDVQFNSVQFGGNNGPKIDSNGSALNVNGAKIDGVADGDISPNSKEAVNGGQIYALTRGDVPNTTNITTTVTNPDGSTTTKTYENVISDKDGKPILTTYNVYGQTEVITNSTLTAIRNMNEQGIKFFHTNDAEAKPIVEDQNKIDSSAAGAYATAVGFQAKANGTNAVAMGKGSQALAENTIAIGTGNIVSATKSGAFGDPNYIDGKEVDGVATVSGSYAFGNDNVINSSNTFVLGNNVNNKGTTTNGRPDAMGTTVENSVYLGNQTTATAGDGSRTGTLRNLDVNGNQGATTTAGSTGTVSQAVVGNLTYGGFAGAKANGVVSVGAAGSERRIQNVAAGEISATSTDAINGSQLYSVARGVSNLAGQVNKMGKRMDANAAAAMAAANLLQAYREGQSAVTAGVGQHRGQAAVAVGYSRLSDSGKIGIKFSLSADTQGEVSTGAGIGYFW